MPAMTLRANAWRDAAACHGWPINVMVPSGPQPPEIVAAVQALCAGCEVREQCATAAAAFPSVGWWGGRRRSR